MSKRIEELEEEKIMEEKDFNLKESSLGDFLNYIRILAKLEERELAEKEFLDKIDVYFRDKIDYCEKPETNLNEALVYFVKQIREELKQKITGEEQEGEE